MNFVVKERALKASWVQYVVSNVDPYLSESAYYNLHPILRVHIWSCNIRHTDVSDIMDITKFWPQVLVAWAHIHFQSKLCKTQMIWYNSHIRIDKKIVFWKKPFRKGLLFISQLFHNGNFISHVEAEDQFGLTILQTNALKAILSKNKLLEETEVDTLISLSSETPVKTCYNYVMEQHDLNFNTYVRWQVRLHLDIMYNDFLKLFCNLLKITNVKKLQSFQFRLLHLSIVTNVQLKQWNIISDSKCFYCNQQEETLEHLFFHCENMTELLNYLGILLNRYNNTAKVNTLCPQNVMFNLVTNDLRELLNLLVLVIKQYIYANRCLKRKCTTQELVSKVELFRKSDLYSARKNNNCKNYYCKWFNVKKKESGNQIHTYLKECNYDMTIY